MHPIYYMMNPYAQLNKWDFFQNQKTVIELEWSNNSQVGQYLDLIIKPSKNLCPVFEHPNLSSYIIANAWQFKIAFPLFRNYSPVK